MPLTFADMGTDYTVKKVSGNTETKHHLGNLGFSEGAAVRLISEMNGNFIVAVKDVRIALDGELARQIYV